MSAVDLPPEDERKALLVALGELVAARGPEPLVRWPLRRTSPADFPDPWTPNASGAADMARRLMMHAGLSHLRVAMESFADEQEDAAARSSFGTGPVRVRHGTAAWFRGIEGDLCLFGVHEQEVQDPEQLAGVLAHEVAHAYRFHHRLVVEDDALEEQLTDLTTVFLGFGILTTNAADRFRSRGKLEGGSNYHGWSRSQAGYLSPPSMALLLAAQLVARHASSSDRRKVRAALERNQAASLDEALRWLEPREADLRAELRVPPTPDQSVTTFAAGAAVALKPGVQTASAPAPAPQEDLRSNKGRPVFRIRNQPVMYWVWRPLLAAAVSLLGMIAVESAWPLLVAIGLAHAYDRWRAGVYKRCSGCEEWLRPGDASCKSCGGFIAGEVEERRDHFDAQEEYWRKHPGHPGAAELSEAEAEAEPESNAQG